VALPRLDPAQARFAAGGILPWHQTAEAARFYHRGGDGCGDDRPMPGTLARRWLTGLLLFHDGRITARPVETRYQAILDGVASGRACGEGSPPAAAMTATCRRTRYKIFLRCKKFFS
jgi:hypothetical protein